VISGPEASTIGWMRVSDFLGEQISNGSRSRGLSYFRAGAVRSLSVEDGVIQATVRGSEPYTVWIETGSPALRASCTCRFFDDRLDICKHIFAAILSAEAQSIPLVPPGVPPVDATIEPLFDDEADRFYEQPSASSRRDAATPKPAPPPPWKQLLTTLAAEGERPPDMAESKVTPGQVVFVIDVLQSVSRNHLVLELMTRERKRNGDWSKPKTSRLSGADLQNVADPDERALFERLLGPRPATSWYNWTYSPEVTGLQLPGVLALDIVPRLCATGRCLLRPLESDSVPAPAYAGMPSAPTRYSPERLSIAGGSRKPPPPQLAHGKTAPQAMLTPIAWDDGRPWGFTMAIRRAEADSYRIDGWLARGDERMELTEPALILADGLLFTRTHAARVDVGNAFAWLVALHRSGSIVLPAEGRSDLIDALLATSPRLGEAPDDLRIEIVEVEPRPRLVLRPVRGRPDRLQAEVSFEYDGTIVPADAAQRAIRSGESRASKRAFDAERRALELLYQRGCRKEWSDEAGKPVLQLAGALLPGLVRQLLDAGWRVEAAGRVYRQPDSSALALRSGIDWFELHGHVDYEGHRAPLPALLAALHRGETFVTLDDGSVGLLPEEWLKRQGMLAGLGEASGDHVRFKPSQVALLDALIAVQPEISWDEAFARARGRLAAYDGIGAADPAPSFTGTLRGYQREGLGWLLFLQHAGFGGCLADDMGLGKTVMVLALLDARRQGQTDRLRPSLIVAPRSLVFNWRQEAARFTPALRVLEYTGGGRAAMRSEFAAHDIVLTTYGTLRRDAAALSGEAFDYVVLDEAQAIKNASSQSAKTVRVLNARHRLVLSGTPIENHLGELWSLFEFLNPGLLGSASAFRRAGTGERLDDETVALLSRGLRPFILRRTKEQVASDLPPRTEQTLYCELERRQRVLYDELRAHYRQALLERTNGKEFGRAKLQVLEALLRLRQAACHPGLIDRRRVSEPSAKLDVLVPRILESVEEGHKTLVFSQFTSFLALLRARLDEAGTTYEYLDGQTEDRQARVERFQTDAACRLFLVSLKAGGLGLNLTAAEYVFLLDPWWNPAVEAQAIDRAHRIGQSRHVFAYRLIARDTVEERVLELQARKRHLADAILTVDNSLIRDLKREDLELLLS
jgi:superfamily II DNA or RNA helicase